MLLETATAGRARWAADADEGHTAVSLSVEDGNSTARCQGPLSSARARRFCRAHGHGRLDGLLRDLHRAVLDVMAFYLPQITLRATDEVLRELGA